MRKYPIRLSQAPIGRKQKQGDNRTPEGDYRILDKANGPFGGDYGAYLGERWMRLGYPKDTSLGGGIGIHGWNGDWNPKEKNDLTWGCVSTANLCELYEEAPSGMHVVILP